MESQIIFFGQKAKINCDGNCKKAWGRNSRPCHEDESFKSDQELEEAPTDPGTYEGGDGKPRSLKQFPNKWCVRECERCNMSKPGEADLPLEVLTF